MLQEFENRFDAETFSRGEDAATAVLGVALIEALREERKADGYHLRRGGDPRPDAVVLEAAFGKVSANGASHIQKADDLLNREAERRAAAQIQAAVEAALREDRKRFSGSFWYAVLVNLFSNTLWVAVSFTLLVLGLMVVSGWSLENFLGELIRSGRTKHG